MREFTRNMKARKIYFFILTLLVGVLTFDYFLNQKLIQLKPKSSVVQVEVNSVPVLVTSTEENIKRREPVSVSKVVEPSGLAMDSLQQFQDEFIETITLLRTASANSEGTENVLQAMARQLEPEQQIFLKNILYNPKSRSEEISLSIELLSRRQTVQSAEILKDFATSKWRKEKASISANSSKMSARFFGLSLRPRASLSSATRSSACWRSISR